MMTVQKNVKRVVKQLAGMLKILAQNVSQMMLFVQIGVLKIIKSLVKMNVIGPLVMIVIFGDFLQNFYKKKNYYFLKKV